MSWNYKDGHFYVNKAGNSIFYIERNPCRCCPDSFMIEKKTPIHKKTVSFTHYMNDSEFKTYKGNWRLRKLK